MMWSRRHVTALAGMITRVTVNIVCSIWLAGSGMRLSLASFSQPGDRNL
ncbi:hypothetical protein KCP70_21700 [Salmonella enterica subsp. enterica]|nr:hypothetical protein KCP70_21700 [Salmonella enterica subsp. enterica]